ncbi:hypothetical protein DOE76_05800 [Leifsonia sp. ku-ls]|nr:hypothetical protein DOE76_05800 [Leifsonia sp. ku-ls]
MGDYYVYRFALETENGPVSYIGQARDPFRMLHHLGASSNGALADALQNATTWPSLRALSLPKRCHGDLGVTEAALIRADKLANPDASANRRNESGAIEASSDSEAHPEYPTVLGSTLPDGTGSDIRAYEFCDARNQAVATQAVQAILSGAEMGAPLDFLPHAGAPIVPLDPTELTEKLENAGIHSALLVYVNARPSDGRAPASPGWDAASRAERCLKYWAPSATMWGHVQEDVPTALIAITGSPNFRVVVGAWRLADREIPEDGAWTAENPDEGDLAGLTGAVITELRFHQASFPMYWLRSGQEPKWVGH